MSEWRMEHHEAFAWSVVGVKNLFLTLTALGVIALAMDPTVVAAGLVLVIGALAAGIVSIITAFSKMKLDLLKGQEDLNMKADKADSKADQIIEKAAEIHMLTNSNLSKVTESLNVALEKISGLEKMVASLNTAKDIADALTRRMP